MHAVEAGLIGSSVLDLVTSGIHDDPRTLYREYLQNSADAFVSCGEAPRRVEITIEPGARLVRIRDNGSGLSAQDAVGELLPLARSRKRRGTESGFRGIGRLAGLVFADRVAFLTRTSEALPVTRVTWNGTELRARVRNDVTPERAIGESTTIEEVVGTEYPAHFFEVEISDVARHAAAAILNTEAVQGYISEVGPVPMRSEFPFVEQVERLLERFPHAVRVLDVAINCGDSITRPHTGGITFSDSLFDCFGEFEEFIIPCADSKSTAAIGWVAHSSYIKAIPKSLGIRGLRVREGNMQIGDEYAFDHLFVEARFNRWCVGEVHVIDTRIVPNATRSYFEPGPHVRNLENHLSTVAAAISKRCRAASSLRNREKRHCADVQRWEELYELARSGYLGREDATKLLSEALEELRAYRQNNSGKTCTDTTIERQQTDLERRLTSFEEAVDQSLEKVLSGPELQAYHAICRALVVTLSSPGQAKEAIEVALATRTDLQPRGIAPHREETNPHSST